MTKEEFEVVKKRAESRVNFTLSKQTHDLSVKLQHRWKLVAPFEAVEKAVELAEFLQRKDDEGIHIKLVKRQQILDNL